MFCFFDMYNVRKELIVDLGDFSLPCSAKDFLHNGSEFISSEVGGSLMIQSHINVPRWARNLFKDVHLYKFQS